MRMKSLMTVGLLSMIAAIGFVTASDSLAAHPDRVDVIESDAINEKVAQPDGMYAEDAVTRATNADEYELTRVDVTENEIVLDGPEFNYHPPMSH